MKIEELIPPSFYTEGLSTDKRRFKTLPLKLKIRLGAEIKALLHAHRDCLRNKLMDSKKIRFDVRDGYYGEAFGIIRALESLNYGYTGAVNTNDPFNLRYWFSELEEQVLVEEGYHTNNQCEYCFHRYGKDDSRKKQQKLSFDFERASYTDQL